MKEIKVKDNSIKIGSANYLRDYLMTLGIAEDHVASFLTEEPPIKDMDKPWDLRNMGDAIHMVHDAILAKKKFYVQVDCDTDGFTSASIFCHFLHDFAPDVELVWGVHAGKEHGIEMDKVGDAEIVIIPDAGSMQLAEQEELAKQGKWVVILDHHEVSGEFRHPNVIVVNNQASPDFSNKAMSGAGIVLMFVKAYEEWYSIAPVDAVTYHPIWEKYLDLAAVGIIADVMDTRTLGNNYIIRRGLGRIRNKILQEILKSRAYSIANIAHPTKTDVAFYVAPLINGLIRSGSQEEKELFFRAMVEDDCTELFTSDNRGTPRTETIYEYAVRLAANAKGRQDSAKKRGSTLLKQKIVKHHLDEHQVIAIPVTTEEQNLVLPTLTGLTAMELSKEYHKPVMVLRESCSHEGQVTYSGSLRADQYYETVDGQIRPVPSLMEMINSSGDGWAEGHPFAAGCGFTTEGLKAFIEYADNAMKNVDFTTEYIEVDYWFKDAVASNLLSDFAKGMYVYGNGIPQPRFAFSFSMNASEFSFIGKDHDTIKFSRGGVEFVMFKQPGLARQLKNSVKTRITCVGKAQINSYSNSVQIVVDSLDIAAPIEEINALDLI